MIRSECVLCAVVYTFQRPGRRRETFGQTASPHQSRTSRPRIAQWHPEKQCRPALDMWQNARFRGRTHAHWPKSVLGVVYIVSRAVPPCLIGRKGAPHPRTANPSVSGRPAKPFVGLPLDQNPLLGRLGPSSLGAAISYVFFNLLFPYVACCSPSPKFCPYHCIIIIPSFSILITIPVSFAPEWRPVAQYELSRQLPVQLRPGSCFRRCSPSRNDRTTTFTTI